MNGALHFQRVRPRPHGSRRNGTRPAAGAHANAWRLVVAVLSGSMLLGGALLLQAAATPMPAFGEGGVSWPSLQGGPAHTGAVSAGVQPPLRASRASGAPAGSISAVVSVPGLAVADARQSVIGFDPANGRVLWAVPRISGPLDPPAIDPSVGENGVVVYAQGNGSGLTGMVAIDPSSRRQLWHFTLGKPALGAPTIANGAVYFGARDDFVYALNAATGSLVWKTKTVGPVDTSPAVADGKVYVVAESTAARQARLYALSASDGTVAWTYAASILALGTSSPTVADGMVLVGMGDLRMHAVDATTGRLRWTQRVRSVFSPRSTPAFAGGSVYVADEGGGLYRMRAGDGSRIWDYQFDSFTGSGAPLVVGGVTYLGLLDGSVAAVDGQGFLVWKASVAGGGIGALTPVGDTLLAPAEGGKGRAGGALLLAHDPTGVLGHVESPTKLRPGIALLDFAVAFLVMLAALLALFRLFVKRRADAVRQGGEPDGDRATAGGNAESWQGPEPSGEGLTEGVEA